MNKAFKVAFDLIISGDEILNLIIATTLKMALTSSILALLIGVPFGILIATTEFPGKKIVLLILRTFMGLPSVVVGIFLFLLFSASGPLGKFKLLYSIPIMVIAQVILITPIVAGFTETAVSKKVGGLLSTSKGVGISKGRTLFLTLNESKYEIIAVYMFAFARSISEVGAVQIVGGNIYRETRVMTTAIALNYNTGDFSLALALGIVLLIIALSVNAFACILQFCLRKK